MKMNNEMFEFVKVLDKEIYYRYLDIDETLGCKSGLVYVAMQIYLESLIRFIIEVENLKVNRTTSLGNYLKTICVQNFFLIDLEYNEIDELSMINSYANGVKHIKYEELDSNKFMNFIKELYIVSKRIFLYYYPEKENLIHDFDIRYYEQIVCSTNRKDRYIELLEEENKELELLYDEQGKINKRVNKENRSLNQQVNRLDGDFNQLKSELDQLNNEYMRMIDERDQLKTTFSALKVQHKELKKEQKQLIKYKQKYITARDKYRATRETMNEYKHNLVKLSTDHNRLKQSSEELHEQLTVGKDLIRKILDTRKKSPLRYLLTYRVDTLKVNLNFAEKHKLREFKNHNPFYNSKKVMAF